MSRRGIQAAALDLSPAMVGYGSQKARDAGVAIEYVQGDMRRIDLSGRFDVAALLMDSAC
jgi:2-polyprenyl-3-methyl-5-hydroxy-6-metoxy-1,4-benzoquinol methylase